MSVGALNAATIAAYPSVAGARMLRELWSSPLARNVFRVHPIGIVLSRLRGASPTALPASNVVKLIKRSLHLTGIDSFERLKVPLQVLATDIGAGRARVFSSGDLLPALQASTAIPGVFPEVEIDGTGYLDGGIVDNMPVTLALEEGSRDVLGIALMAGGELERRPTSWAELMARTLQLSLHQRMLADFARVRRMGRVVILCPLLGPRDGLDMRPDRVDELVERTRHATMRLIHERGRRLLRESCIHYLRLDTQESLTLS